MIDSHCHLVAPEFDADRDSVIARALSAGVTTLITIADAVDEIQKGQHLAEKYDHIFYTAGVHPHHAKMVDLSRDLPVIRSFAEHPKCTAIGEIGLDYHYMNSEKDVQKAVFQAQLELAKELDLPAVVHCREAVEDVWSIVERVNPEKLVIHCCTEQWEDVKTFAEKGYVLSFTGIVTYPKAEDIRETVRRCPLSQLMVETDAPFLAPVPHRGKRCEPMHVVDVARKIAEIKGVSFEEVDRITTENAREFFGLTV
jgi:TatD DNase family protein